MLSRLTSLPLAYLLLWCGSLALSILLVVLLRTRWGQSRPLHKCAVLSLLVHLLLAWVAMTFRIVAGDRGGGAEGPPIRVRVVHDAAETPSAASAAVDPVADDAPPLLRPPAEPIEVSSRVEEAIAQSATGPAEAAKADPTESVAELNPPPDEVASNDEPATVADPFDPPAVPPEPTAASTGGDSESNFSAPEVAATAPPPAPVPGTAKAVATSASTPYALRNAPDRLAIVERQGGSGHTEAAVAAGLRWLAAAQSPDGRWDANQFGAGQEQAVLGHNRGGAGRNADTGISALALLAFLGAGHSHQHGAYQDTVHRGLDFLLRSQAADGSLFGDATFFAQMYCHSMATFALAEAQAMTGDERLRPAVTKAVNLCLAAQHPSTGGWRYRAGDVGDTSQLGWQMMALASAERAGVAIPAHAWLRVERFLQSVRRGSYGGLACYRPDSGPSTAMTAEALYCRLLLADVTGKTIDAASAAEATNQLLAAMPNPERINLYYWYYASLALHHRHQLDDKSSAAWHAWNDALTATLVNSQVSAGPDAGSWNTNTVWGGYGGRVYTTAMATMCLEVYYRYAPTSRAEPRWTATRPEPAAGAR